jgi:valyl-tRNA synthetase
LMPTVEKDRKKAEKDAKFREKQAKMKAGPAPATNVDKPKKEKVKKVATADAYEPKKIEEGRYDWW